MLKIAPIIHPQMDTAGAANSAGTGAALPMLFSAERPWIEVRGKEDLP